MLNPKTYFEQVPIEAVIRTAEMDIPESAEITKPAAKRKLKREIPRSPARAQGAGDHES